MRRSFFTAAKIVPSLSLRLPTPPVYGTLLVRVLAIVVGDELKEVAEWHGEDNVKVVEYLKWFPVRLVAPVAESSCRSASLFSAWCHPR